MVFLFWGLWRKFRENKSALPLLFLILSRPIIFWPFKKEFCFILPILPFCSFSFFLTGSGKLLVLFLRDLPELAYIFLFAFLFIFNILNLIGIMKSFPKNKERPQAPFKNFILLNEWIINNLPKEGLIISRKPVITYFYTNRKSICYPFTQIRCVIRATSRV